MQGLAVAGASSKSIFLLAHGALGAYERDELVISATLAARPVQVALASVGTFSVGAAPLAKASQQALT